MNQSINQYINPPPPSELSIVCLIFSPPGQIFASIHDNAVGGVYVARYCDHPAGEQRNRRLHRVYRARLSGRGLLPLQRRLLHHDLFICGYQNINI